MPRRLDPNGSAVAEIAKVTGLKRQTIYRIQKEPERQATVSDRPQCVIIVAPRATISVQNQHRKTPLLGWLLKIDIPER